jgi:hypothetical protein
MTEYIGYALKRISFYPDRGRVAEFWEPGSGKWREEQGRVDGLVVGHCPRPCVVARDLASDGADHSIFPEELDGTVMEVCRMVELQPEADAVKPGKL